jgi:hypothetical protein
VGIETDEERARVLALVHCEPTGTWRFHRYGLASSTRAATGAPSRACVALTELAREVHGRLLALAVGAGLQVMAAMMEADMTAACGP